MAKATTNVVQSIRSPEQAQADARAALLATVADNAEALADMVKLAALLKESGILDIANAILAQRKAIVDQLVGIANQPGSAGGIKTLIALAQGIGQVDAASLGKAISAASAGLSAMTKTDIDDKPMGIFELLRVMKDPDVSQGLHRGMAFLKGLGQAMSERETDGH